MSSHASHEPLPRGYVLDASYADTFFQELSPAWLSYARALNGVPSKPLGQPFTYLELGAGLASSTVVNAGAFPHAEFHACDFNPAHVSAGRAYAEALGLRNFHFHEAAFEQLPALGLPSFDYIVLHGVYSWVGAEARGAIRTIIRQMLAPGGLVYVSYNCMPGWASELPLRRLLVELAADAPGSSADRMRHAVQALRQMSHGKFRFFETNPEALQAVEAYERVPGNYLAHEFLNETWQPFYSTEVADDMAEAHLTWLGSATLADNHPMLVMDDAAAEQLKALGSPRQLHLAMDFATNRRFRRDLFIHASTPRSQGDASRALNEAVIGCVGDPRHLPNTVKVPRGHVTFQPEFMEALKALLEDGSTTLGEATAALASQGRNASEIARNLMFLVAGGALMPFARVHRQPMPAEVHRPATATVERSLALTIQQRVPRAIPSEILGNGVIVRPEEALAIIELLGGVAAEDVSGVSPDVTRHVGTFLLPALARLRLVV